MIQKINHSDQYIAKQIANLQKLSYQVEAELIGFYEIPPLKESHTDIVACSEVFCGYFEEDKLIGVISYTCEDSCLNICRVAVHPSSFRQGIAEKLLRYAETANNTVSTITVSTARDNLPAISLYKKMGFQIESTKTVADVLTIVILAKRKELEPS